MRGVLRTLRSPAFWLRLLLTIGMLVWVVRGNGGLRIGTALLAAQPGWALAAAVVFFLSILGGAYQWHLLLRLQGIDLGFAACFRSYYAGMFLNNFMPGTVGGDALRVWDVHHSERTAGVGKAAAATVLDRVLGFAALAFFSLLSLVVEFHRRELPLTLLHHLLAIVGAVSVCFGCLLAVLLSRHAAAALHTGIRALGLRRIDAAYAKMQASLAAYRGRWKNMAAVFFVACLVQVLRIAVHALSAGALRISIAPSLFFSFIPLIALAAILPVNVGGWGLPQSLGAYLYGMPGVLARAHAGFDRPAAAAALAFLPSVIGMAVMLGGGFYFVMGRKKHAPVERRIPK